MTGQLAWRAEPGALAAESGGGRVKTTTQTAEKLHQRSEAGLNRAIAERRAEANRRAQRRTSKAELQRRSAA